MAWDWGRIGRGVATSGISELMREKRTDNEYAGQDRNNYNLPGYQDRQNRIGGMLSTGAPQSSFRGDQASLAAQLRARASGAESLSREQLRRDAGANIASQQALAASGRPGNAALAGRMAAQNAGRIATGLSGNTAMAGIAERTAAQQQLGALAGQARDQDINASLGQQQINQGYSQQELQNAQMQQQGGFRYEGDRAQRFGVASQQPTSGEQYLGLIQGGAGAALAMSDKRAKTDVQSGDADAQRFMDSLKAMNYSYKPSGMLPGELAKQPGSEGVRGVTHTGVMAQDLEKSPAGRAAVMDTPGGKVVSYGQLAGTFAAALANLNNRMKKAEGK
jgi:hypothetical protein